jgi:two-component system sensor kinase FixL
MPAKLSRSLRAKLTISIIILFVLLLSINTYLNNTIFEARYAELLKNQVVTVGQNLEFQLDRLLTFLVLDDLTGFNEICREVVAKNPDISNIYIIDTSGRVLYHSGTIPQDGRLTPPDLLNAILANEKTEIKYKKDREWFIAFIIPIFDEEHSTHPGSIVLEIPARAITSKMFSLALKSLLGSSFFFAILFILVYLVITRWVTRPILELDAATRTISEHGPESFRAVTVSSQDEIGRLAASFNKMAGDLQQTTVSKSYVDSILATMSDALIVTDARLNIQTINQAACSLLGLSAAELSGKSFTSITKTAQETLFTDKKLLLRIRSGQLRDYESAFETISGTEVPVLLSCSLIEDEKNTVRFIVITAKDISERKRAEAAILLQTERLTRSNAELQEFTYVAAHDLQEPLRKISTFSERIAAKNTKLDEQSLDYLSRIRNAAARMQALLDGLLTYSRITTATQPFQIVELKQIAKAVTSDLQSQLEKSKGIIEIGELPAIEAEPDQIRQLFQHIICNALQFQRVKVPPHIKISARISQGIESNYRRKPDYPEYCEILFEDNGIGIKEDDFDHIFGIFRKLSGGENSPNTGMGLAICQRIAERHHGRITVASKVGSGTQLRVRLPLRQRAMERDIHE